MKIVTPKISIVVRTYNSEAYVARALDSLVNQSASVDDYEVVVVDDGSGDKTKSIVRKYRKPVRLVVSGHVGAVALLNLGISKARGEWVMLIDSDDFVSEKLVEEYLQAIDNDSVGLIYGDYWEQVGEERKLISTRENVFDCTAGAMLYRKEILSQLGYYDESLFFAEYDLLIKFITEGHQAIHIGEPMFTYVRHKGSMTSESARVREGIVQLEEKYGQSFPIREY